MQCAILFVGGIFMRKNFGVKTYIYPQPVLIVGTYDEQGLPNAMNAAWGGICDRDKVFITMSEHRTTQNIAKTKAFTVGIGDAQYVTACDYVGIVSAKTTPEKMEKSGFTTVESAFVQAPIIEQLPISLECTLEKVIDEEIYIGRIVNVSIDEQYLDAHGMPDLTKLRPITYDPANHNYVALGEIVGKAFSDGNKLK